MKRRISLLLLVMVLIMGCQDKGAQKVGTTPTEPAATTPGEENPSDHPENNNEYHPKDNRMENLQLSADKDKFSYEPDADAGDYDENYTQSVESPKESAFGQETSPICCPSRRIEFFFSPIGVAIRKERR